MLEADIAVGDQVKLAARGECDVTLLERDRSLVLRSAVPMGDATPPYDFTRVFALRGGLSEATRLRRAKARSASAWQTH